MVQYFKIIYLIVYITYGIKDIIFFLLTTIAKAYQKENEH